MAEEYVILHILRNFTSGSDILIEYNHNATSYHVESVRVTVYGSRIYVCWPSNGDFVNEIVPLALSLKLTLIYGVLDDFCKAYIDFDCVAKCVHGVLIHVCLFSQWAKLRMYIGLEGSGLCGIVFFERFFFAVTASPRKLRPWLLVSNTGDLFLFIKTILSEPLSFPDWLSLLMTPSIPWSQAKNQLMHMHLDMT